MSEVVGLPNNSYKPIAPMVGGSLRLPPPLKLNNDIAEILLKVALKHQQQKIESKSLTFVWALRWFIIVIYSS
jgi:hypothetical protein